MIGEMSVRSKVIFYTEMGKISVQTLSSLFLKKLTGGVTMKTVSVFQYSMILFFGHIFYLGVSCKGVLIGRFEWGEWCTTFQCLT